METVPMVRETGGLRDTVCPYNEYEQTGNGFSFANYNAHEMLHMIRYAKDTYVNHRNEWNGIVKRAMECDFHGMHLQEITRRFMRNF